MSTPASVAAADCPAVLFILTTHATQSVRAGVRRENDVYPMFTELCLKILIVIE